jgi:hypothetical protein
MTIDDIQLPWDNSVRWEDSRRAAVLLLHGIRNNKSGINTVLAAAKTTDGVLGRVFALAQFALLGRDDGFEGYLARTISDLSLGEVGIEPEQGGAE